MITLLARWWWCRGARSVARRVLCAAPDAALRVPCAVPDAFLHAPLAVPDAALYRTSSCLWAASRARRVQWWFGLLPVTPAELQARPQTLPRIQSKRVHLDGRPASAPNVRP